MSATDSNKTISTGCWEKPGKPSEKLLEALEHTPLSGHAREAGLSIKEYLQGLRRENVNKTTIYVGAGTCGLGAGAAKTLEAIRQYIEGRKLAATVLEVGCVGLCSEEPIVDIQIPGKARISFGGVDANRVPKLLDQVLGGQVPEEMVLGQYRSESAAVWPDVIYLDEHSFLAPQKRLVLAYSGIIDPNSIDEYIALGGYSGLAEMLASRTPEEVCQDIIRSGLRGRGGGGFPTGRKWDMARQVSATQKYLICNADEGDPGAFMDRAVGESDPHRLIEGMAIAAYAIGATRAYIYIRAEYPLAVERLTRAIAQAQSYGLLGNNILDSGLNLKITIKMGAGAFVCGEETALMHSIEGKRGMPRPRPPYPAAKGLFNQPTVINNVETLANLPSILSFGVDRFAAMGTEKSKGTKVFALSGTVSRTGLVEVPMGTSLRDVVFKAGGGISGGKRCKAVQIGGPSGGCIPEKHLDIPCDYEALKEFGAIMGSGGLVVMDENTCMVDLAKYFMEFIQSESCGKCIPCREGTRRMLEILKAITQSRKHEKDSDALMRFQGIMQLQKLAQVIRTTSLCGLGQTAPNPVLSTLRWFRDEYEAHVFERRCPAGACKELVGAPCQTGCPVETEVWRYVAHIARGEYEDAYRVIRQANPFPSICARVCNHPCEAVCRCGTTGGEPIAVRTLKRFVVDRIDPSIFKVPIVPAGEKSKKVAVIGAGPSGLTAAHQLSAKGFRVTIFEKESRAGGMLIGAIPEYRLPRNVLEKEIGALLNENVEVKYNMALGQDFTVDDLLKQGYEAVYLSMGAHQSKPLGIPGEETKGVLKGIQFLKAHNLRGEALARGRVGIIGGGNSAIDAARVAVRQPGVTEVTIFYRRTENEMPAYREEIDAAREEGIQIRELVAPVKALSRDGQLYAVEFLSNELGEPDSSGRRRPVPVPGSEHVVELDTLIAAISEEPEPGALSGQKLTRWGTLEVNPESGMAGRAGVFGGGDVVRGPNTVVEAIADGKRVALMIERYLTGRQLKTIPRVKLPSVYIEPIEEVDGDAAPVARVHAPHLPACARHASFAEVEQCIEESAALLEARRCLRCDLEFTQAS